LKTGALRMFILKLGQDNPNPKKYIFLIYSPSHDQDCGVLRSSKLIDRVQPF
jgi:hypothetical protein